MHYALRLLVAYKLYTQLSMKIGVSKISYKGSDRIRIEMPYNAEITGIINQIPDAKWSMTLKSWKTLPVEKFRE